MPLLARPCGLETELAIRQTRRRFRGATWRRQAFEALLKEVQQDLPAAPPLDPAKQGMFLANGGAVWFEAVFSRSGLVEIATPECRGPSQLLTYQRAMEQLARRAASRVGVALIKNDQDASGQIYGAQENYEVELDARFDRWSWRVGLIAILPLIVISALLRLVLYGIYWIYLFAGLFVIGVAFAISKQLGQRAASAFFGEDLIRRGAEYVVLPHWLERISHHLAILAASPMIAGMSMLARIAWCRRQRRQVRSFLLSRVLIAGAGSIDARGNFLLADKAPGVNALMGIAGLFGCHPVFPTGHLLKGLLGSLTGWVAAYARLFARHQRLQIALGDSNRAEHAEFLKVGAMMLVLDAADAGYLDDAPQLRAPLKALSEFTRDLTLSRRVPCRDGTARTALEIQRYYFKRCLTFVLESNESSPESEAILARWEETLEWLEASAGHAMPHETLVGSIDWVTKRFFLEQLDPAVSWEARKKADIRYHELSSEGYFEALTLANLAPKVIESDAIERAERLPPADSPAAKRGRMIREFGGSDYTLLAGWDRLVLRTRGGQRTIWLHHSAKQ